MNIFGMSQWEIFLIMIVVLLVIGPDRLPEAMDNLRRWIRQARDMANEAKKDLRSQVGDDVDLDWRKWDPRQYNPRRIVREALMEDLNPFAEDAGREAPADATSGVAESGAGPVGESRSRSEARRGVPRHRWGSPQGYDPLVATPFDAEAT